MSKRTLFESFSANLKMNKVKFPKRHSDNSFCVEVILSITTEEPEVLLQHIQNWAFDWIKENQVWVRKWSSGEEEQLYYEQEFKREPYPVFCNATELRMRLDGKPTAKWWKDWLVLRILYDLKTDFNEVQGVIKVEDCN